MIPATWVLTLFLLAIGSRADNPLGKDIELEVSSEEAGKRNVLGFNSFIGNGKEDPIISLYFEHNFGMEYTIIGDIDTAKWGIQCLDSDSKVVNTCRIDDGAADKESYIYSNKYLYKDAHVAMRLLADEKIDIKDTNKLPIRLVTSDYMWPLNKLGVIGLTPNGDFAKYVTKLYTGDVELLFGYNIQDINASNEKLKFNNHVVVNPVYVDTVVAAKFNYDSDAKYWGQKADVKLEKSEIEFINTNVCFSSISNELIILIDSIVQCDRVRAQVCNGQVGNKCTEDIYKIEAAPILSFKFGDKTISFTGNDYIYIDNKVVQCRFGDLSDLRSELLCPEDTEVAIGRTFFSHYYPSLTFNSDGKSTLTFITQYNFNPDPPGPTPPGPTPPTPSGGPGVLIILGIVALYYRDWSARVLLLEETQR